MSIELIIGSIALIISSMALIFVLYRHYKNILTQDVKSLIKKCRACISWDRKSESKLINWMEGIAEEDLHRASIRKLLKIKESLVEYFNIHIEEVIKRF